MAKCKRYFQELQVNRDIYPSNAAALVADGTIQALEVVDDESIETWKYWESADKIKIKVEGIEEIIHLGIGFSPFWLTLRMGDTKIDWTQPFYCYCNHEKKVLAALHDALRIPKYQTKKMIQLLFCPHYFEVANNFNIQALEC